MGLFLVFSPGPCDPEIPKNANPFASDRMNMKTRFKMVTHDFNISPPCQLRTVMYKEAEHCMRQINACMTYNSDVQRANVPR